MPSTGVSYLQREPDGLAFLLRLPAGKLGGLRLEKQEFLPSPLLVPSACGSKFPFARQRPHGAKSGVTIGTEEGPAVCV